jgi:hypothetical protein
MIRRLLLPLFICFFCNILFAQVQTAFEQLAGVNKYWLLQPGIDITLQITPAQSLSERELVRYHLQQVEQFLRKRNVCHLPDELQQSRARNLNTLHDYWEQGTFPINDNHLNRQPYFIDNYGTYCAVGFLMKQSGADAIARRISATQNYFHLFDIADRDLLTWAAGSGFTLEELALIQPEYGDPWPCSVTEFHYNNTGVDQNEYIEFHQFHGQGGTATGDTIKFYDWNNVLYKTLPVSAMQLFYQGGHPFYYYVFPANESFADSGTIEIRGKYGVPAIYSVPVQTIIYNSSMVIQKDYYNPMYAQPSTTTYTIGENENTPGGSSLNFCGGLVSQPVSIGNNPCLLLPLSILAFDHSIKNKKVQLSWKTSNEINNSFFEIQRSRNGTEFTTIGKVNGSTSQSYTFTDDCPAYINHYRLKQVDADGNFTYSKILFVRVEAQNALAVINNPVKDYLRVQISAEGETNTGLMLYDMTGRLQKTFKAMPGFQTLDVSELPAGNYLLRLYLPGQVVYNQAFIKQ